MTKGGRFAESKWGKEESGQTLGAPPVEDPKGVSDAAGKNEGKDEIMDKRSRLTVAENPSASPESLAALGNDADERVRHAVAKNPSTSAGVLAALGKDESWWVRQAVAKNPNTPVDTLVELGRDDSDNVRYEVALNPSTPMDLVSALGEDDARYVRLAAGSALSHRRHSALNRRKADI